MPNGTRIRGKDLKRLPKHEELAEERKISDDGRRISLTNQGKTLDEFAQMSDMVKRAAIQVPKGSARRVFGR